MSQSPAVGKYKKYRVLEIATKTVLPKNDNLCGAKFSLNLWIKNEKRQAYWRILSFLIQRLSVKFSAAYVVLCRDK